MSQTHPKERSAQLMWTGFILVFFLLQAALWTFAISITAGDKSHTVVADYDEQALQWDEVKRMRQSSSLLGWNANILVDADGDILGNRVVTVKLVDREEQPLENANVELKAFHRGTAAEVQNLKFSQAAPGVYSASVQVTKSGQWQFSGSATHDEDQFFVEHRTALTKADSTDFASPPKAKN